MESFNFHFPYDKEQFIRQQIVLWKLQSRQGSRKQRVNFFIAAAAFLALGILAGSDDGSPNPFILVGILFMLYAVFSALIYGAAKRRYIRKTHEVADKYEAMDMDCTYEFSEEFLKYTDKEKAVQFRWSMFTYYTIYDGYLLLLINDSFINAFVLKKEELPSGQYENLVTWLKSKLNYKEISSLKR
ncbi:MAG TPA: hypothetical protein DDZ96_01300 [Porphyromonadaceae bacterium]|jgi:hypothetical protein|uniref:hypothetical protein n=1 Tax=Limibacterium fermenti TaxID=3229863 RepID=UPI000E87653F|nr:hypothetical protein [Porphyromonadaceae bacterium]HBL32440.1 hypothetical protein [Porphyromonadaceae bacterium]HBX19020.1 hypothetical protein [Porphyromonadaceae bacterium]HBX45446.1 hypothetical protein [Porphyromonadaceae bacterium]